MWSYLYPWSVNLDYIRLLNRSNFISACKEKMLNKENIVSKKFLLIEC